MRIFRCCGALKTKLEKSEYGITMILAAIIFIIIGILIKYGKMYWLIAGYNTMPKEEKEKYNIAGIANVFRNVMFGMALIVISGYLITELTENPNIQNYAFWTSMIIGIPYLLIKSNSKKYKIKN